MRITCRQAANIIRQAEREGITLMTNTAINLAQDLIDARARIAELENPDMTKLLPVRTAAKNRHPLDGADAQCMEHAITITERERDAALKRIAELEDTWKCDKCGGVWPNPKFDNPDLQAEFDAVTTCVHCVSLEMAKKRIAELEAAAQWHPASEPPEDSRHVLIEIYFPEADTVFIDVGKFGSYYDVLGYEKRICWQHHYMVTNGVVARWRDLPPMPERSES